MSKRILVVEDDADIASIVASAARYEGWEVAIAANGADALRAYQERGADLLVVDLHLPGGLDGAELFTVMCDEYGDRPAAIVLSAAREAADVAKSLELPFVGKPFELDRLIAAMRRALEIA